VSAPTVSVVQSRESRFYRCSWKRSQTNCGLSCNLKSYAAIITRHAGGTSSISGNAYATSNK
jgi:hypothetical protein